MKHPRRVSSVDLILGALAFGFGLMSLEYPFGRDQGLFYYVAREWLLRGQVLYRDVWDHKPPVIYFIHMLAIALFGEHMWGIRLLELVVAVPLIAWATARLATPRGQPLAAGVFGAAWLAESVIYYGYTGFWETGQCEIWGALFAALALAAVARARNALLGYAVAGALSALVLFTKLPMAFFVVLVAGAVVLRARERPLAGQHALVRALAAFTAGGSATAGVLVAYFAALHALGPMQDILVGANAVYEHERVVHNARDLIDHSALAFAGLEPYSGVSLLAVGTATFIGIARRERALPMRYGLAALLAIASYATVAVQLKFYAYHWGTIVVASGVLGAAFYADLARSARQHPATWLAPAAFVTLVLGFFVISGQPMQRWAQTLGQTVRYELGLIDREEFSRSFDVPWFYAYHDAELTGIWIRQHSKPNDTITVRGFEPEIYAVSHRYFTGRFFWTTFLTLPSREYRRDQWLAEDSAALRRRPPRYAITYDFVEGGIESPEWFEQHGYQRRTEIGVFVVLERAVAQQPPPPAASPTP